jgi:Predicted integral membrane protein
MDTMLNRASERPAAAQAKPPSAIDAKDIARTASVLLGGVVVVEGLRRRSAVGLMTALAGAELIRQGVLGRGAVLRAMGVGREEAVPEVIELTRSLTILRSPDELYALWRNPETLPRLLDPMLKVTVRDATESDWRLTGPLGLQAAWRSRVVEDIPGERVAWISQPGAWVPHAASIRFKPTSHDRETEVILRLRIIPPGILLGSLAEGRLKTVPGILIQKVLRRFKALAETGEIATHRRSPACRGNGRDE